MCNQRFLTSIFVIFMISLTLPVFSQVRVHCDEDIAKVEELLEVATNAGSGLGNRIVAVAQAMQGTSLGPKADNDSIGTIMVNLHTMDQLSFLNNVLAIAIAARKPAPGFNDYVAELERISRKKGKDEGFASQLFYGSEWITENVYNGTIKEMTEYLTGGGMKTKTLDYVTRHKDDFPALADSLVMDKMKQREMGLRSHRIPHLKKQSAGNKSLHELLTNGDIIMLLSNDTDFDFYDVGFVELKDGVPYLIHFNTNEGLLKEDEVPLPRLFKIENQRFYGYRWLHPID